MVVAGEDLQQELLDIERGGWTAISERDADYYRKLILPDTVVVDDEGIHKGVELVEKIKKVEMKSSIKRIGNSKLVLLDADCVALTYRIDLELEIGDIGIYASSVYVRRDGVWKLALHQQTPILRA